MSGRIDARLMELGIVLPKAAAPAANYVPFVVTGNLGEFRRVAGLRCEDWEAGLLISTET
jgi:hypothetical protein